MNDSAVAVAPEASAVPSRETIEALRAAVGPDLTNGELQLAVLYAQKVGADLFARDIYPVKVDGRLTFITSIDFARSRALSSGGYQGQGRTEYGPNCTCEGEEVKLARAHPEWAEVPVHREGFLEPMVQRAYFHEYAPLERAKDDRGGQAQGWLIKYTWRKMPHVMVAKVSEMLALRKAFPRDLQQLYVAEEMEQAGVIEGSAQRIGAGDIPPDPEKLEGLEFSGPVYKVDGPREVKLSRSPSLAWASDMGLPDVTRKTEIAFTVSRRRHTAVILGDLAIAVADLQIKKDEDVVACDGEIVELDYPGRGTKPKKKELHHVTRFAVLRDNAWVEAGAEPAKEPADDVIEGEAKEVAAEAEAVPTTTAPPAAPSMSSQPAKAETPGAPDPAQPAAPSEATPQPGTSDPGADPESGDDWGALMDGPAKAAEPEAAKPIDTSTAMNLNVWTDDVDSEIDLDVVVVSIEPTTSPGGKSFAHGWLMELEHEDDSGVRAVRLEFVMEQPEAEAQGVYKLAPGQVARIVGTWVKAGARTVVLTTALVPA